MSVSIIYINQLEQSAFVALLGDTFEETPMIAAQTWLKRPFEDLADLHSKMVAIVERLSPAEQLALIRAHPELGSKRPMAEASVAEQASAGLNHIEQTQRERLAQLNSDYRQQFGFPFIMAVKGQTQATILRAMDARMANAQDAEIQRALSEIYKIARFRLQEKIAD